MSPTNLSRRHLITRAVMIAAAVPAAAVPLPALVLAPNELPAANLVSAPFANAETEPTAIANGIGARS